MKKWREIFLNDIAYKVLFIVVVAISLLHATLGMHSDELHSLALGDMIASGNYMFKECWFYLQLSSVFNSPLIFLYKVVVGNTDGVAFFIRVCTILFQALIAWLFYETLKKDFNSLTVWISSVLFLIYVVDFPSLMYKQELILFTFLLVIFLYRYYKKQNIFNLIGIGVIISLSVLAFPTSVLYLIAVLYFLYRIQKIKEETKEMKYVSFYRDGLVILITCVVCASIFMIYIGCTIGIKNFIDFFPLVFVDENLNSNFIHKLIHPLVKIAIIGILTNVVLKLAEWISKKWKIKKENVLIFTTMVLLLSSFGLQIYIENGCITWHIINYPYTVSFFAAIYLLQVYHRVFTNKNFKVITEIFKILIVATVLVFSLASNQGNITCMYGMILAAILLIFVIAELINLKNEEYLTVKWKSVAFTMMVMAFFSGIFLVYEAETTNQLERRQRNIFTERIKVNYGPLKDLRLGEDIFKDYQDIYETIKGNVGDNDSLLVLANHEGIVSLGHLISNAIYATYSPQGGWKLGQDGKLVKFYEYNPHLLPSVIVIDKSYITDIELWYDSPDGQYIKNMGFKIINEDNRFYVLRRC